MSLRHRLSRRPVLVPAMLLALLSMPITRTSAAEILRAPIIPRPLDPVGFGSGETRSLVMKDLDQDNHLDLFAVSNNAAGVYWGVGSTRMSGPTTTFAGYAYQRRPMGGDVGWLQNDATFGAAVVSDSVYVDMYEDTYYFAPQLRLFTRTTARTFAPGRSIPLAGRATDVVLTNLDGDDWADAVVVTFFNASPGLIVFEDVAAPTPGPVTPITTPGTLSSVVAKDITGDGNIDLVAVEVSANHGFYLPGDGAGGFGARVDFSTESFGQLIDVADFDGQHGPDLYFRGFTFGQYVQFADGVTPFALPAETIETGSVLTEWGVVADVDQDGKLDIVSNLNQPRLLGVHLGDGAGAFADAPRKIPTNGTGRLAAGDLDEDGKVDLVGRTDAGTVLVHPGNGDGTFGSPVSESPSGAHSLRLADIDGDGHLDAISAGEYHFLAVQHGVGDGTFGAAETVTLPGDGWGLEIGKFDSDAYPDIFVVARGDPSKLLVYTGGPGPLPAPVVVTLGVLTSTIALADVDADGDDDVLFPDFQNPSYGMRTLRNNGGSLTPVSFIAIPGSTTALAVGRLDGDAVLDVAVGNGAAIRMLKGNGDGSFTLGPVSGSIPGFVPGIDVVQIADLDGDHDNDVVASARWENLYVFPGDGAGNLAGPVIVPPPILYYAIPTFTLLDADRDGDTDVFIAMNYDRTGAVLPNRGDGTFDPGVIYGIGWEPMVMDAGDVNGDGGKDVVVGTRGGTPSLVVSLLSTNLALVGVDPPPPTRGTALALGRAWPNPSRGAFDVELTAATAAPIELSLISLGGRRIGDPMTVASGLRRVRIEPAERLSPGVYWILATQGSARASGKVVVLP
jgi:hypothetical protein